jgi:molybdopterin-guanine dinucleotide biosynthesis protein A
MNRQNRSAIVLAGGFGKRLQGFEKCLLEVSGIPMIKLVLSAVNEVCDEIVVSVNSPSQRIRIGPVLDNATVVYDSLVDVGPLEGIRQACRVLTHNVTAIVACDMPLLNPRVIEYLFAQIGSHDGVIPMWPDGKLEPLCSVFKKQCLKSSVENAILSNIRKIVDAFTELDIHYVEMKELENIDPGLHTFVNVNDKISLERVRSIAGNLQGFGRRSASPDI